ncbi:MAG: tetratricopeptide repeat-containing sensor histidine kinase [Anaerolineaceae bacterium]|nr:tetratricopeptide repeat-containing sensor histidine kinase [Anaerolineaceae bacterium]
MLKAETTSVQNIQQEINETLELAWRLRSSEPARAVELAQKAYERSINPDTFSPPYQRGMAVGFLLLGLHHIGLGDYDEALSCLFSALPPFEDLGEMKYIGETLDAVALVYSRLGAYPEALHYYEQKLNLVKILGDKKSEAALLNHIGVVEILRQDGNKALESLRHALAIFETLEDLQGQAQVLGAMCNAHCELKDYERARVTGERSAAFYRQIHSHKGEAEALNNLGEVSLALGEYDQARCYFEESLKMAREAGLQYEAAHVVYQIGNVYAGKKEPAKALRQYQAGLVMAEEIGGEQLCAEFHRKISEIFKLQREYEKALHHHERFHQLKAKIFDEATAGRLRNLEIAFQAEAARQELQEYRARTTALNDEIAERKQVEENLREANKLLQIQITEREQLISDLDSFAHMVAHDLKNPLQIVIFGSQMLMDMLAPSLDEELAAILQNILQMGQKMRAIIDELLILASVRQQEITLQPLDMAALVRDVKARLAPLIEENGAVFIMPEHWPSALGHAPWVEEVWTNYLSNAIKYGGKPPRVGLGATPLGNGYIRFWVSDNGTGIKSEAKQKLFQPFKRFSPTQATGHGLGLSIVKRIVEKLGGEVAVESAENEQGCVFSFTLTDATPFVNPPQTAPTPGAPIPAKPD